MPECVNSNKRISNKRKRKGKSVKYWTLITIDSENCDPKRLTARQQLAYFAKRAQSGSLLSDFPLRSELHCEDINLRFLDPDCNFEISRSSRQDFSSPDDIDANLKIIAEDGFDIVALDSFVEDEKVLIKMAEDFSDPSSSKEYDDRSNIPESEFRVPRLEFLTNEIAEYLTSISRISEVHRLNSDQERRQRLKSELVWCQ